MQFKERTYTENALFLINVLFYKCQCRVEFKDIMTLLFWENEILRAPHPDFFLSPNQRGSFQPFINQIPSF